MMFLSDLQCSLERCHTRIRELDAEKEKLLSERDDSRRNLRKWKEVITDLHEVTKLTLDMYGSDPNPESHVIFIHIMRRIANILKNAKDKM